MNQQLTKREQEVATMVCNGLTNKEIAVQLGISARTVDHHREHVYRKLDVHNVAELCQEMLQPE